MILKTSIKTITLCIAILSAAPSWAVINVKLKSPKWEFLLQNQPWGETEAQLAANESRFAKSLQPLLAAQDHAAIEQAFKTRDINSDSAALRLLRGQVLLSLKRNKEAERALLAALTLMPNLASAHRSLSMVYMLKKQYKNARAHLTRTIEMGIADAQVYGQLAFVNLQLGQAASAVAGYQYALLLESGNDQWQQGLMYALIQTQAYDQAQALIEEALLKAPNNADLWLQRGQLALKQQRLPQSIASLEKALTLGVKDPENIATTAQLHIQGGSPRRAVELINSNMAVLIKADKVNVLDQISAWLVFQEDWRQLGRLLSSLKRSKLKLPASYRSRFSLYQAQLLMSGNKNSAKNLNSASQYLRAAIDADPTNGDALLTLATVLRDRNRNQQSSLYYTRAEALPLFKERALLGRSQLEINRKNYRKALHLLRSVLQINPGRSDLLANILPLENLVRSQR